MMSSRRTDPRIAVDVGGVFGQGRFGRHQYRFAYVTEGTTAGDVKAQVLAQLNFPAPELFYLRLGRRELRDEELMASLGDLKGLSLVCRDVDAFHKVMKEKGLMRTQRLHLFLAHVWSEDFRN